MRGSQEPTIQLRFIGRPRWRPQPAAPWRDLAQRQAAVLLMAAQGRRNREQVAALYWAEQPAAKARDSLRDVVRVLSDRCPVRPFAEGEVLRLSADVGHDLAALFDDTAPPSEAALPASGQLFEGLDFTGRDAFLGELTRVRQRWAQHALRQLLAEATRCERSGRGASLLALGERLVDEYAHEESAWQVLMRALYALNRVDDARQAFQRCQQLREQARLGAVSAALRSLALQIDLGQPLAPLPAPDASPHPTLPDALLGRDPEFKRVEAALQAGQPLWLRGEAGIGKSHLLRKLASRHPGWLLCDLRQPEPADAPPAYATLQLLLRCLWQWRRPELAPGVRAELARLVPEFGEPPALPTRLPALLSALQQALQGWARQGLQAVLLDDAQAIDGASAQLLAALLAPMANGAPDRVAAPAWLFASRGTVLPEPLSAQVQGWQRLDLGPLDEHAVAQVLRALTLPVPDPQAWARLLVEHTLGNPQKLQQTLLALIEREGRHVLRQPPPTGAAWPLPPQVHELVQLRVQALAEAPRQLVKLAALAGGPLPVGLACEQLRCTDVALSEHWALLENAKLLDSVGLAHATLQAPIAALVPAAVARSLHAHIAAWGEAQGAPAAELAAHWRQAERWPEAAAAGERAAAQALSLHARVQAVQLFDAAADAHERAGGAGARAAAFELRVQAFDAALEVEPPAAAEQRTLQLVQRAEGPAQGLKAALARTRVLAMTYRFDAALACIDAAMPVFALAPHAPPFAPALRPVVLQLQLMRAHCLSGLGRADDALQALEPAAAALTDADGPRLRMNLLTARGGVHFLAARIEPAIEAFEAALAIGEQLGDAAECLTCAANVAGLVSRRGDCARSRELFLEARRWRDESGPTPGVPEATLSHGLGTMALRLGRYREALAELRQALSLSGGLAHMVASARQYLAAAWLELGDADAAQAALGEPPADARGRLTHMLGQAMLLRHAGQPTAPLLLPIRDDVQRVSLPLMISLDLGLSLEQPRDEAVATCRAAAQLAQTKGMRNFVLAATLREAQAWWRAGDGQQALPLVRELLATVPALQPGDTYLPSVWLLGFEVLQAAGATAEAEQARGLGAAWVERVARQHVPPELRQKFRHDNPVNAALLGLHGRA